MARTIPTYYPEVGEHLYLRQYTHNMWVDSVKHPYTVVAVDKVKGIVKVQECELIFNGPRYYDTLADEIKENPDGRIVELRFANAKGYKEKWIEKGRSTADYPLTAVFGQWMYEPYLN